MRTTVTLLALSLLLAGCTAAPPAAGPMNARPAASGYFPLLSDQARLTVDGRDEALDARVGVARFEFEGATARGMYEVGSHSALPSPVDRFWLALDVEGPADRLGTPAFTTTDLTRGSVRLIRFDGKSTSIWADDQATTLAIAPSPGVAAGAFMATAKGTLKRVMGDDPRATLAVTLEVPGLPNPR